MSRVQVIYLNGPSSVGKSTLARALQATLPEYWLHFGLDRVIGWMGPHLNRWQSTDIGNSAGFSFKDTEEGPELTMGPAGGRIHNLYIDAALWLVARGEYLIIDDVAFAPWIAPKWQERLAGIATLWVGLEAPLNVLAQREKARGHRLLGSAHQQALNCHHGLVYDLRLNTHALTLEQQVEQVLAAQREKSSRSPSCTTAFSGASPGLSH